MVGLGFGPQTQMIASLYDAFEIFMKLCYGIPLIGLVLLWFFMHGCSHSKFRSLVPEDLCAVPFSSQNDAKLWWLVHWSSDTNYTVVTGVPAYISRIMTGDQDLLDKSEDLTQLILSLEQSKWIPTGLIDSL
ncbi:MAG: hypothetical protein Q9224_006867, partial [Gallowayella concinna]